jgi:hypothetical protein
MAIGRGNEKLLQKQDVWRNQKSRDRDFLWWGSRETERYAFVGGLSAGMELGPREALVVVS